jgi:guanylate kinase
MPLLIVLSGPSGVGKDAVLSSMKGEGFPLYYTVTLTTRPQRDGEINGVDYYFTSDVNFQSMVEQGELLEWAKVYGHLYGVPKQQVRDAIERGEDVIIKVDVQGATTIKNLLSDSVLIFLAPPSIGEQKKRLKQRCTESDTDLKLRTETFHEEMNSLALFDYIVVNHRGKLDLAVSQIKAIISAEKCRVNPRQVGLQ